MFICLSGVGWVCEQLCPSAVYNGKKMRVFCLLEYLFIVRKWKKQPACQVHKQSWEKIEARQVAIYLMEFPPHPEGQVDSWCVYNNRWKERTRWISSLFYCKCASAKVLCFPFTFSRMPPPH